MSTWAIRGAINVEKNNQQSIVENTENLLREIVKQNSLSQEEIVSVIFTMTPDLDAEFPALAARNLGWREIPLLCAQEIPVIGSMPLVVRVLLHVNLDKPRSKIKHVYLKQTSRLREDLND